MAMYEERVRKIEAEQWDGTIDGAAKVQSLLPPRFRGLTITTDVDSEGQTWSTIKFERHIADPCIMHPLAWLVKNPLNGHFSIMHNDEFMAKYDVPMQTGPSDG